MARRRILVAAGLALGAASAACSAILGLDAPPSQDAGGPGTKPDGSTTDSSPDTGDDGGADAAGDGQTGPVVCTPVSSLGDGGTTYFPLAPTVVDDAGTSNWTLVDVGKYPGMGNLAGFAGGTFDGRYVYFSATSSRVVRVDTQQPFDTAAAWSVFDPAPAAFFQGAVFDGRYVYFVPYRHSSTAESIVARFDTLGAFTSAEAWTTFDLSTLAGEAGVPTTGFYGAVFEGQYVYFVPNGDPDPDGRVLRYDTTGAQDAAAPPDAALLDAGTGEGGDGGDTGAPVPGSLQDPAQWASFDVSSIQPEAKGFAGGVLASGSVYLVPNSNDAWDAQVHSGLSAVAVRHNLASTFSNPTSWNTYDTTKVNGLSYDFAGGAFDGQFLYFAPYQNGIAVRHDITSETGFAVASTWSTYDTTHVATSDAGTVSYQGAAFDGRFVYFIPHGPVAMLTRYDTWSTFGADCAWSAYDPTSLVPTGSAPSVYAGAVFDGQYLYLVPNSSKPVFARFLAKTPGSMPSLPSFHGSFF